jgi:hypothetical protein
MRRHRKVAVGAAFTTLAIVAAFLILFRLASQGTDRQKEAAEEEKLPEWMLSRPYVEDQVSIGKGSRSAAAAAEKSIRKPPPTEPSAHPKTLLLKVDSSPIGAWVVIDKVPLGFTPFEKEMEADGRTRTLMVTLDGYRPKKAELEFSKDSEKLEFFTELKKKKSKVTREETEKDKLEATENITGKDATEKPTEKKGPAKAEDKKKKGDEIARDLDE